MHKNATKCNETLGKWCKNKHGASKIMDTLETYQLSVPALDFGPSDGAMMDAIRARARSTTRTFRQLPSWGSPCPCSPFPFYQAPARFRVSLWRIFRSGHRSASERAAGLSTGSKLRGSGVSSAAESEPRVSVVSSSVAGEPRAPWAWCSSSGDHPCSQGV
jgi:hypothetical protein